MPAVDTVVSYDGETRSQAGTKLTAADEDLVCPVFIAQLRSIALAWFLRHMVSPPLIEPFTDGLGQEWVRSDPEA